MKKSDRKKYFWDSLGSADLFRPKAEFEATVQPDGSIRLVELSQVPIVKPRRVDGRLLGAEVQLTRETVASAVRFRT